MHYVTIKHCTSHCYKHYVIRTRSSQLAGASSVCLFPPDLSTTPTGMQASPSTAILDEGPFSNDTCGPDDIECVGPSRCRQITQNVDSFYRCICMTGDGQCPCNQINHSCTDGAFCANSRCKPIGRAELPTSTANESRTTTARARTAKNTAGISAAEKLKWASIGAGSTLLAALSVCVAMFGAKHLSHRQGKLIMKQQEHIEKQLRSMCTSFVCTSSSSFPDSARAEQSSGELRQVQGSTAYPEGSVALQSEFVDGNIAQAMNMFHLCSVGPNDESQPVVILNPACSPTPSPDSHEQGKSDAPALANSSMAPGEETGSAFLGSSVLLTYSLPPSEKGDLTSKQANFECSIPEPGDHGQMVSGIDVAT